jgi:hypothetical protein
MGNIHQRGGNTPRYKNKSIMNEAQTRAELIDPKLKACGWGVIEGCKVFYQTLVRLEDAKEILGDVANISRLFIEFQEHLYKQKAA